MAPITTSTEIDRSADDVFAYAIDPARFREWQQGVLEMVREEGADKRSSARFLALGVNGLAVALMVTVFASTGGITGAEVGIAGGSAVLGQRLLEAVFGDQAVRRLGERARADLNHRMMVLLEAEQSRYSALLDGLHLAAGVEEELRSGARAIDDIRFASPSF